MAHAVYACDDEIEEHALCGAGGTYKEWDDPGEKTRCPKCAKRMKAIEQERTSTISTVLIQELIPEIMPQISNRTTSMNSNNAGAEHPIKRYRERVGLSQDALARQIGVTQGMIWQWEQGLAEITADRAVAIEEKIGEELPAEALSATIRRYEELRSTRKAAARKRERRTQGR
jgi:DNA-binding transcriptional regulator YdaS (Cro superfamily)